MSVKNKILAHSQEAMDYYCSIHPNTTYLIMAVAFGFFLGAVCVGLAVYTGKPSKYDQPSC